MSLPRTLADQSGDGASLGRRGFFCLLRAGSLAPDPSVAAADEALAGIVDGAARVCPGSVTGTGRGAVRLVIFAVVVCDDAIVAGALRHSHLSVCYTE